MNTADNQLAPPDEAPTTPRPRRKLLIGGGLAATVLALLIILANVPGVNQALRLQSSATERTDGYNITNNSGAILIFQSIGGHVGAPLPAQGAWLPGETLNFEVESGDWVWDSFTGDAFFEAYTVGGPNNGTDAGTVDVHFNTTGGDFGQPMAYLNPDDTAPLVASAVDFTPVNNDGEIWTMLSGADNRIVSGAAVSYTVSSDWSFRGVTADQLRASVTAAKDGTCTTPTSTTTNCTLGNTSWSFTWT